MPRVEPPRALRMARRAAGQDRDTARCRHKLMQQRRTLPVHLGCQHRDAGHAATRLGEAIGHSLSDWVLADEGHYDRHGRGCFLDRQDRYGRDGDDDIGLGGDRLARQLRHARRQARVRRQCQIAAFNKAEPRKLGQLEFPKVFDRRRGRRDKCNAIETTGLLGECQRWQQCTTGNGQQELSSVHHALPNGVHGRRNFKTVSRLSWQVCALWPAAFSTLQNDASGPPLPPWSRGVAAAFGGITAARSARWRVKSAWDG